MWGSRGQSIAMKATMEKTIKYRNIGIWPQCGQLKPTNYSKNNKRYCHVYILLLPVSWLFSLTWEPFWLTVSKPFSFRRVNISLGLIGIFCISFPYHTYIAIRIYTYVNCFVCFSYCILWSDGKAICGVLCLRQAIWHRQEMMKRKASMSGEG